jgi:hypothetical protein
MQKGLEGREIRQAQSGFLNAMLGNLAQGAMAARENDPQEAPPREPCGGLMCEPDPVAPWAKQWRSRDRPKVHLPREASGKL